VTEAPVVCVDGRSDPLAAGRRPRRRIRALIWLVFVVLPLIDAINSNRTGLAKVAIIAGAAAFVATYVAIVAIDSRPLAIRHAVLVLVIQLAIASALTVGDREGWATLFIYTAGSASAMFRPRLGLFGVALATALLAATLAIHGSKPGTIISYAAPAAGVGSLMLVLTDLRESNRQLVAARAELARAAVAQERERFARDLHDLLGHSLSVIALKAELARRLLPGRPDEAAVEVADVERVARQALGEVRDAVSGYRQPTLDGELAGARMALAAAGIATDVRRPEVALDPAVEAVLAWTVREGATNVIRHSGARRCTVAISASLTDAVVEVVDDGAGTNTARSNGDGHGLAGLAERARDLDGRLEAAAKPGGGYRLAVTVPRSHA
jgi:two-component system sensor histidine kinase DesK